MQLPYIPHCRHRVIPRLDFKVKKSIHLSFLKPLSDHTLPATLYRLKALLKLQHKKETPEIVLFSLGYNRRQLKFLVLKIASVIQVNLSISTS